MTVEQHNKTPQGLWAGVARAAEAPTLGVGDVWRGIERRLLGAQPGGAAQLWRAVAARSDPAQYRPCAVPDVPEEQISEGEQQLVVIRSPRGNYLRLTPVQCELWHQMDGARTVAQLATGAFLKHKQLLPVGDLVSTLKQEGFLAESPIGVYRALARTLEARTAEGWGRRVLRWLSGTTWRIRNIDGLYQAVYRALGWLLFTPAFVALWLFVAVAGLGAFILLILSQNTVAVVRSNAVPLELAGLWLALLVSFLLHESAHALAVKHYRRTLYGGGVMLYFGTPAFFVDTSDIWRSPRRARMLVSAAGPMSDLFVGALAALLVLLRHDAALAPTAYKLALTCYVATLFNLNPLLELDGYFILVDWLRLPDLRRRALAFVRGPLRDKLRRPTTDDRRPTTVDQPPLAGATSRSLSRRWSAVVGRWNREERIFTLYGALALLYAVVAVTFAVQFWNRQLIGTITDLWFGNSLVGQVVAAALVLLVVLPLLAGLGLAGVGLGRTSIAWLIQRGYGRRPALLSGVAVALALALTLAAGRAGERWYIAVLPPLLWAIARGALLAMRPDYRGAAIAPALDGFAIATVLATIAALLRFLFPDALLWWSAADGLAMLALLVAGFCALLDVNLRVAPARELLIPAALLVLAFGVGGLALLQAAQSLPGNTLAQLGIAAPAYFGVVALALLLPHMQAMHDSRLVWAWALAWGATTIQTIAYVIEVGGRYLWLDVLVAALWAGAWLVHLATLRQITPTELEWQLEPSVSEGQRLVRAFTCCYAGCYRLLRAVYGSRRTTELDDRMDVLAATANWDVTLDRDEVRIGAAVLRESLDQQGERFAEVLRYTVATIENIAGQAFALRAIQAAYDALPWPERETASRLCFPDTPWARTLSAAFGDAQAGRLRLLRQADLLLGCDDAELVALARHLNEQNVRGGAVLLRAGEQSAGVWLVTAGEVLATPEAGIGNWEARGGTRAASAETRPAPPAARSAVELHRGEAFGATEVLNGEPSALTYKTTLESSLLFIPAAEFRRLVGGQVPHAADGQAHRATLRLLQRVPLFADLPRATLLGLVQIAREQQIAARAVIVRQDQTSGVFYIITQGRAGVIVRGAEPGNKPRLVAQLGAEEFFGEIELLRGTPPVATIVSATAMTVLALPHDAVRALLLGDSNIARSLEQIGTGRLITLRQGAVGAA